MVEYDLKKAANGGGGAHLVLSSKWRTNPSAGVDEIVTVTLSFLSEGSGDSDVEVSSTRGAPPTIKATTNGNTDISLGWTVTTVNTLVMAPDPDLPGWGGTYKSIDADSVSYTLVSDSGITLTMQPGGDPVITAQGDYSVHSKRTSTSTGDGHEWLIDPDTNQVIMSKRYGLKAKSIQLFELDGGMTKGGFDGQTQDWSGGHTYLNEIGALPQEPPPPDPLEVGLDQFQSYLDWAGMIPVLGEAADLLNAGIHLGRGNIKEAGMALVAMAPGGDAFKLLKKGGGALAGGATVGIVSKYSDDIVEATGKARNKLDDLAGLPNCFVAGTQVVTGIAYESPVILVAEQSADDSTSLALVGAGVAAAFIRYRVHRRGPSTRPRFQ